MSGDRLPWIKFWPSDWQSEPSLRMVSLASRGLWIELLSVMHDAVPYGHLVVNGVQPNPRQIAALVGGTTPVQVMKLLHELEDAGVFSRTAEGTIYSRRMVRDNVTREKSRDFGRQGGNPALKPNGTDPREGLTPPHKPSHKPPLNGHARAFERPEAEEERTPAPFFNPTHGSNEKTALPDWVPAVEWGQWEAFRASQPGKRWTLLIRNLSLASLDALRLEGNDPAAVIRQAIAGGYTGFVALPRGRAGGPVLTFSAGMAQRRAAGLMDADLSVPTKPYRKLDS